MLHPTTRFARAGDVDIAYQVVGDGPVDLVWAWGLASSIDTAWEDPSYAAFLMRLAAFSRLVLFDRRGCGASDRGGTLLAPTLEERVADVIAVLDAVGSDRASIFGVSEGGNLAAALGAMHPRRVASIILYATPEAFEKDTEHLFGVDGHPTPVDFVEWMEHGWGTVDGAEAAVPLWAPSMIGDDRFTAWLAKHSRQAASRDAIAPLIWSARDVMLAEVFPTVRVPALVLHRRDDRLVPIEHSHRIAELLPDGQLAELDGQDHLPFVGDTAPILAEVEEFLVGARNPSKRPRQLLTALVLDIVDTPDSVHLSAEAFATLMSAHDETVRAHLSRFDGRRVTSPDTESLAVFDGPGRAIRCATGIMEDAARAGLHVRAGLHAGECDRVGDDVTGVAVRVGVELAAAARPGEILTSSTVRDLVPGSGIRFGRARTIGMAVQPAPRAVFPVLTRGVTPERARRLAVEQQNLLRLDGEYWTVAFGGRVVALQDRKGLHDLARLLATPGREFHVIDLVRPGGGAALNPPSRGELRQTGLRPAQRTTEPIIDDTAVAAYKRRIGELEDAIEEADATRDDEASARARMERDAIVDELSAAYGLGSRRRRTPDHVERARKTVSRRIRTAITKIDEVHPALGRHLDVHVRTGVYCSYVPEQDTTWAIPGAKPTP